ncbi:MAG: hypothetical protein D3908_12675 [Candidatus Electrothrix sp. AUS4]|nr:hypothetical protein [Candidatus Electrothrix sp. AUS4]
MKNQRKRSSEVYEEEGTSLSSDSNEDEVIADDNRDMHSNDPMNIYLREMGGLDLLSYEEEIKLAQKSP